MSWVAISREIQPNLKKFIWIFFSSNQHFTIYLQLFHEKTVKLTLKTTFLSIALSSDFTKKIVKSTNHFKKGIFQRFHEKFAIFQKTKKLPSWKIHASVDLWILWNSGPWPSGPPFTFYLKDPTTHKNMSVLPDLTKN